LPGFALTVPQEVYRRLSDAKMRELLDFLERSSLDMDHGIPVAILKDVRFALKRDEAEFCTKKFIVTACGPCNRGLGNSLESYEFFRALILNRVCRGDEVRFKRDEAMFERLYLKAKAVAPAILSGDAI
jgi:hypothetical protein